MIYRTLKINPLTKIDGYINEFWEKNWAYINCKEVNKNGKTN